MYMDDVKNKGQELTIENIGNSNALMEGNNCLSISDMGSKALGMKACKEAADQLWKITTNNDDTQSIQITAEGTTFILTASGDGELVLEK